MKRLALQPEKHYPMHPYHYPDFNDILILQFLEEFEKNESYWGESEKRLNRLIIDHIRQKEGFCFDHFLDAGSGRGRLLHVFKKYFNTLTAIEPDIDRFADTVKEVTSLGIDNKSELFNVSAEDFKSDKRFGLILCSHVIQHIHTDTVMPLMVNLRTHLENHGIIALTTCHSTNEGDYYRNNYLRDGVPVREEIGRETFNASVNGNGMLPVHYFEPGRLMEELKCNGLHTVTFKVFHVAREDRDKLHHTDVDSYVNADPSLQKRYGVDMFLLLEKI